MYIILLMVKNDSFISDYTERIFTDSWQRVWDWVSDKQIENKAFQLLMNAKENSHLEKEK